MYSTWLERAFAIGAVFVSSIWTYFAPIHNLMEVVVVVLICNFLVRFLLGAKRCRENSKKMEHDNIFYKIWSRFCCYLSEFNVYTLFKEACLVLGIISFMFYIHSKLSVVTDTDTLVMITLKWSTYVFLIIYSAIFIKRFVSLFSESPIKHVFDYTYNFIVYKSGLINKLPFGEQLQESINNGDIKNLIHKMDEKKDTDNI